MPRVKPKLNPYFSQGLIWIFPSILPYFLCNWARGWMRNRLNQTIKFYSGQLDRRWIFIHGLLRRGQSNSIEDYLIFIFLPRQGGGKVFPWQLSYPNQVRNRKRDRWENAKSTCRVNYSAPNSFQRLHLLKRINSAVPQFPSIYIINQRGRHYSQKQ